jgi:hypothetical protein
MSLQKRYTFTHNFQNVLFPRDSCQTGQFPSGYKTLMYAIGRQNGMCLGGRRVAGKRRGVLVIWKILLLSCKKWSGSNPHFLHPWERIQEGAIRAHCGLSFPVFLFHSCKNLYTFTHSFSNVVFPLDSGQMGQFPSSCKTLMYAIGWQNGRWLGGEGHLDKKGCFGAW